MPNSALARSINARSIPSLVQDFPSESIGTMEETKAALLEIFPDITWVDPLGQYKFCEETMNIVLARCSKCEVMLQQIEDGDVLFLSVRSKDKNDIKQVAEKMGLRIIDKRFGPVN